MTENVSFQEPKSQFAISNDNDQEQHTYLGEKYVQEAEAREAYIPLYTNKKPKPFPEGRGPYDLTSAKNYNLKLEKHLEDSAIKCDNNPLVFAKSVEDYFKLNLLKKHQQAERLRAELRRIQTLNKIKSKAI